MRSAARWQVVALTVGWLLAAVTLWQSGAWVERIHRFDGCSYIASNGPQPFWVCPAGSPSPAVPADPEPGGRA